MSSNFVNTVPYLITSRIFSEEIGQLTVEMNICYADIANAVNNREIGIYPTNMPAVNGKSWFFTNQKQQGLQQLYTFTAAGNIPHGINVSGIYKFSTAYGSFTDGTNSYGVIYGSNVAIAGQLSFYITSTNIVVIAGVGAPAITSGLIVVEWISNI